MTPRRKISQKRLPSESTVRIGKMGVTEAQIKEILKQLKTRRKVRIKVLRSALTNDTLENIAQRISSETDSKVVQIIGHTFTLYKRK